MGSDANAPESVAESAQIGSPQEEMEKNFDLLNSQLGDDLLKAIMDCDPKFFEKLVIDLLAKMGYGQGRVTQYSNDGGESTASFPPTRSSSIPFAPRRSVTTRQRPSGARRSRRSRARSGW